MRKRQSGLIAVTLLALVGLLFSACGPSQQQTASIDEDAIAREVKAASEAANAALVAGDAEGYLAHYMDDPPMGFHPISIIVKNGNVSLEGVIDTEGDKSIAGMQANSVSGVFSVTNNLQVLNPRKSKKK